jgi:hypothetical protein
MSKILKIKESAVLSVINKIITEQATSEITVTASNELGTHPSFDGLKVLLNELRTNVQTALRGETPYKIKTTSAEGTIRPGKKGNELVLSVTLVPTEESKRHWFFEGAAAIYSYVNTTSFSSVASKVRMKAMDKARASFAGAQPQELFPNHITVKNFTNLNTVEPTKEYKIMMAYLTASRPEGYYEVGGEETPAAPNAANPEVAPAAATVAKSEVTEMTRSVSGSFPSNDGDSAHNFAELENKIGPVLKEFYDKGINPKIKSVTAKITKNNNGFSTSYSAIVGKSDDGKAWMGFTSRGSFGIGYEERADGQISGSSNKDGRSLEEKLKGNLAAGEIATISVYKDSTVPVKQYFVQFTKPKDYPAHT